MSFFKEYAKRTRLSGFKDVGTLHAINSFEPSGRQEASVSEKSAVGTDSSTSVNWITSFQSTIRYSAATRSPLSIEGGGTRKDFAGPAIGDQLSAASYSGVVRYDPDDLVVTVRAGTPLSELEAVLAEHGHMLGFEPPCRNGSTIGGAVALGWSGPRRPFAGALRDHLIGVRMLDGLGRDLLFGGQVVKNVAGFDVSRLMAGSLGILGLLLEVSLRVVPLPKVEQTTAIRTPPEQALETMRGLSVGPGLLSAAAYVDGELYLRSSGSDDGVACFLGHQGGRRLDDAASRAFWHSFNNHTHAFFKCVEGARLWRVSVRPDAPCATTLYPTAVDWAGALRWIWAPPTASAEITAWARTNGGHATLWTHATDEERSAGVFENLAPALMVVHQRLKAVFDPKGIFNTSRMYAQL